MQKLERIVPAPAPASAAAPGGSGLPGLPAREAAALSLTKLLLVDCRDGETVHQHPEVVPFLQQGWAIRSAMPRLVESKGTRLLVVLGHPHRSSPLTRIK